MASSITTQGRSLVSAMGMVFESFLSNNVKFGSLNEVITFIDNVINEKRYFADKIWLDKNISYQECFCKLIYTCGFEWIPTNDDLNIIWDYLCKLSQTEINRIYYKNNLYEFLENTKITNMLIKLLDNLEFPFMNPNKPPKTIEPELELFSEILMEYVYYGHMIIDRQWRMDNMIKNVCAISDTDSTIISLDAFYRFTLEKVKGRDFKLMYPKMSIVDFFELDEFGEIPKDKFIEFEKPILDFDFYNDEVIELQRSINLMEVIPQDGLRYSIINIIAYVLDKVVNDYMKKFCINANSYDGDCLIISKNEYLFKRALLTDAKKNYATIQELQEGNVVDYNHRLDLKGLAIDKSSMNNKTRKQLKELLLEEILDTVSINQIDVLKQMAVLEKGIYQSLKKGSKEYYKPVTVKPISTYENPMRIQGIKGAIVWNIVKGQYDEAINLEERNALDIVKVNITPTTIEKIKDNYPVEYSKLITIIGTKEQPADEKYSQFYKGTISSIAIPKDAQMPKWLLELIDYTTIINDNLCNFPLESIGVQRLGKDKVNYTNMINL